MEGSAATRGEDSSEKKRETASLDESAPALSPPIMAEKPGDIESPDYEGRVLSPTITAERSSDLVPSLEEKAKVIKAAMNARAKKISALGLGTPTNNTGGAPPKRRQDICGRQRQQHGRRTFPNNAVPVQEVEETN
jgi:hypothetical protein